jgi:hypothetical protein
LGKPVRRAARCFPEPQRHTLARSRGGGFDRRRVVIRRHTKKEALSLIGGRKFCFKPRRTKGKCRVEIAFRITDSTLSYNEVGAESPLSWHHRQFYPVLLRAAQ